MNTLEAISKRYSHKGHFSQEKVPMADLERIAQAGLDAPSGGNLQTVQLVILHEKEMIDAITAVAPAWGVLESATAAIAVLTDSALPQGDLNFEKEDYSCAVQNMLLAATDTGYVSLWLDSPYFAEDKQKAACEVLGAPESYHLWAVLPIGKPAHEVGRREKLPFEKRVSYGKVGSGKK